MRVTRFVVAVEAALVAAAVAVGLALNAHHVPIHADAAPLFARWLPHAGPGTPLAVAAAVAVISWGVRDRWPVLLLRAYGGALLWTASLALVDGWSRGVTGRLTPQAEYLTDVPRVTGVPDMLAGFAGGIVDRPGAWATHVAGHPPGAFLLFVLLDRAGLGGGTPAALLCVLAGATVAVSVPCALRSLGHEDAARASLPFVVLFPGAVWMGVSADAVFAAAVAGGLALLAARRWWAWAAGGLLLGYSLYLSYGLVLVGLLALVVLVLRRRWAPAVTAAGAAGAVVVAFTAAGFWWLDGYHRVVERYYQGWAAERPYGYWVWADLACLILSAGPVIGPALARIRPVRSPVTWLPVAAAVGILAADLSGLSKAEVERIWLPYAVWLMPATALLPPGHRRGWLIAQAATALLVNHLLLTEW